MYEGPGVDIMTPFINRPDSYYILQSIYLSINLSIYPSIYLSIYQYLCLRRFKIVYEGPPVDIITPFINRPDSYYII